MASSLSSELRAAPFGMSGGESLKNRLANPCALEIMRALVTISEISLVSSYDKQLIIALFDESPTSARYNCDEQEMQLVTYDDGL